MTNCPKCPKCGEYIESYTDVIEEVTMTYSMVWDSSCCNYVEKSLDIDGGYSSWFCDKCGAELDEPPILLVNSGRCSH